jgi:hypothetical protein
MATVKNLADFLVQEIQKRGMTNYSFAQFIGVSHTTINRLVDLNEGDAGYPTLDFFVKLAESTQTDIRYLITLVVPENVLFDTEISEQYLHLSKRIEMVSPPYRKIIELIIDTELENNG